MAPPAAAHAAPRLQYLQSLYPKNTVTCGRNPIGYQVGRETLLSQLPSSLPSS